MDESEKDDELKEIQLPEADDDSLLLDDDDIFDLKPKKKIVNLEDDDSLDELAEAEDDEDEPYDDRDEW